MERRRECDWVQCRLGLPDGQIPADADRLWGNGGAALAVLLARRAAQTAWPGTIVGFEVGALEELPVRPIPQKDQAAAGDVDAGVRLRATRYARVRQAVLRGRGRRAHRRARA